MPRQVQTIRAELGQGSDQGVGLEVGAGGTVLRGEALAGRAAEIDAPTEAALAQAKVVIAYIAARCRALAGLDGDPAVGVAHRDGGQDGHRGDGRERQRAAVVPVCDAGIGIARHGEIAPVIALAAGHDQCIGQTIDGDVGRVAGSAHHQATQGAAAGAEEQVGAGGHRVVKTGGAAGIAVFQGKSASSAEARCRVDGCRMRHPQGQGTASNRGGAHRGTRVTAGVGQEQVAGAIFAQGGTRAGQRAGQGDGQSVGVELVGLVGCRAEPPRVIGAVAAGELQNAAGKADGAGGADGIGMAQAQGAA